MSGQRAAVIGAGSWGTALAAHLAGRGVATRLWCLEPEVAAEINSRHTNGAFLDGIALPESLTAGTELSWAAAGAALVLLVVPSQFFRRVLTQMAPHLDPSAVLVNCAKGIEEGTGHTMVELCRDVVGPGVGDRACALSGPSFAREVANQAPTAVTVASRDHQAARLAQQMLSTRRFRVYTSDDVVGVELGGAVKNPLAIAAGMCDGLGLGHNAMAGLVTRGLAELTRLALALGAQAQTMAGLAGMGDLVLTCYGPLSRNRTVGTRLAKGESIEQITTSMNMVAEGVRNTRTVLALAGRHGVEMPITQAVRWVLYDGGTPQEALEELMSRDLKAERV